MKALQMLKARETVTITGVLLFAIIVGFAQPSFLGIDNLARIANSAVILALLAAASAIVIITRNIDVSVGSTLALTGIVAGLMFRSGLPLLLVILLTLLLGAVLGAINGLGVTYGHIPSIVMTLGTLGAYRGISFLLTGGHSIETVPADFKALASAQILGVPTLVWVCAGLLAVLTLLMSRTGLGRSLYATGDNTTGAQAIGINTNFMVILAFSAAGTLAALAALVFLSQIGSISNQAGSGIEMRAIAAAVIGGVALSGGVGTLLGSTFGALFITMATSSLSFLGIPGFWGDTVIGAILLVALFADARVRRSLEVRRLNQKYAHAPASELSVEAQP